MTPVGDGDDDRNLPSSGVPCGEIEGKTAADAFFVSSSYARGAGQEWPALLGEGEGEWSARFLCANEDVGQSSKRRKSEGHQKRAYECEKRYAGTEYRGQRYLPPTLRSRMPLPGTGASGYSRWAMAANSCLRAATAPSSPGKVKAAASR